MPYVAALIKHIRGRIYETAYLAAQAALVASPQRRTGGRSVHEPCATSAAMPIDSPKVGCG